MIMNKQTEAIIDALIQYVAEDERKGSHLIEDLARTSNGRIVRQTEAMEQEHFPDASPLSQYLKAEDWTKESTMFTVNDICQPLSKYKISKKDQEEIQDSRIREILRKLKNRSKEEIRYIKGNLTTEKLTVEEITFQHEYNDNVIATPVEASDGKNTNASAKNIPINAVMRTLGDYKDDNGWGWCEFINIYTQDEWTFHWNKREYHRNYKSNLSSPPPFYMSDVITLQFETLFDYHGWPLALPKIIHRRGIINEKTDWLIYQYRDCHNSEAFMDAFLTQTVNGKSSKRVANNLGLKIQRLEVSQSNKKRPKGDFVRLKSAFASGGSNPVNYYYSVACHLSPIGIKPQD